MPRHDPSLAAAAVVLLAVALLPPGFAGAQDELPPGIVSIPDDTVVPTTATDAEGRIVALAALEPATRALLISPRTFPDALASSVLQDEAMLLPVGDEGIEPAVLALLEQSDVADVTVLGGTAAIPEAALQDLPDGVTVTRIGGAERIETAALIARAATDAADTVLLARARGPQDNPTAAFIDAIGAGALSARTGWPLLLVDGDVATPATSEAMAALDPDRVVVLGGEAAVSTVAADSVAAGRPVSRLAGPDRYATAAEVAGATAPQGARTVIVVDGTREDAWADGFPAARVAVRRDAALVLSAGETLPAVSANAVAALSPTDVVCLAPAAACLAARAAAGLPAAIAVAVDPPTDGPLPEGATVRIDADAAIELIDDGGCVSGPVDALLATAAGEGCTIVTRLTAPGVPGQTTTITWPPAAAPVAVGPADFATRVLGNPWDYDDVIDARTDALLGNSTEDARVDEAASALMWDDTSQLPILWAGFPGAQPVAPDGLLNPIDADRYTHLQMRVWTPAPTSWSLQAHTCPADPNHNCIAAPTRRFDPSGPLDGGWTSVVADLRPSGWSGQVHLLYLRVAGRVVIDDVRLTPGPSGAGLDVAAPPGVTLTWDVDDDPGNNGPQPTTGWGTLPDSRLDADALPPGRYWVHGDDGSTRGPFVLATPPSPRITTPSVETAEDWATAVRGNPWDFAPGGGGVAGTDDVAEIGGASDVVVGADGLRARNTGNDPFVVLAQPAAIDPARYDRIVLEVDNDGPLDLSFGPGGGTHARILWRHPSSVLFRDGQEIIDYGNQSRYVIDMAGTFAAGEAGAVPWTAEPVVGLRIDPNEDPASGRAWRLGSVRVIGPQRVGASVTLSAEEGGLAGSARDIQWQIGTTPAGPFSNLATDRSDEDGRVDTTVSLCGQGAGERWIAVVVNGDGGSAATVADTPLDLQGC